MGQATKRPRRSPAPPPGALLEPLSTCHAMTRPPSPMGPMGPIQRRPTRQAKRLAVLEARQLLHETREVLGSLLQGAGLWHSMTAE